MFGLSIKEKLYKALLRQCEAKQHVFEEELFELLKRVAEMGDQEATRAYSIALQHYTSAITEAIHQGLDPNVKFRFGLVMMQPEITGLPKAYANEFDDDPFAGKFFALYYYAITGNPISSTDYDKYIRQINQRQGDLISNVLQKLSD